MKKQVRNYEDYQIVAIMLAVTAVLVFIGFHLYGYLYKMSVINTARSEEGIVKINSVNRTHGRPYTKIEGIDSQGNQKVVWIDSFKKPFNPVIVCSVNLKDGITEEQALEIAKNNNLLCEEDILEIFIHYQPEYPNNPIKQGIYWCIRDKNWRDIYIDFFTGKYTVFNRRKSENESNDYYNNITE